MQTYKVFDCDLDRAETSQKGVSAQTHIVVLLCDYLAENEEHGKRCKAASLCIERLRQDISERDKKIEQLKILLFRTENHSPTFAEMDNVLAEKDREIDRLKKDLYNTVAAMGMHLGKANSDVAALKQDLTLSAKLLAAQVPNNDVDGDSRMVYWIEEKK